MNLCLDQLLGSISMALDAVEGELLGASTNHGKRITCLCMAMGQYLGLQRNELFALAACALMHDNALTEYILSEQPGKGQCINMALHCTLGQNNVENLPFSADISGFVLYHHERADGKGPFGKCEGEIPLGAELIGIADRIDIAAHLQRYPIDSIELLLNDITQQRGTNFSTLAADALLQILDKDMLTSLRDENIEHTFSSSLPCWTIDVQDLALIHLSEVMAHIIDYKSRFTLNHSLQVANKAWWMCNYYKFDKDLRAKVYLAAALHDLGKLKIPSSILEKAGPLDEEEFSIIQDHVLWTSKMLNGVVGLEDVCRWASNHHERLDSSGYPYGKTGDNLDFVSRLLACIDLYQGIREERPYHKGSSHKQTMAILHSMARNGIIDASIVSDLDLEMAKIKNGIFPSPLHNTTSNSKQPLSALNAVPL